jgi:tripartite-type tricarboxylate transporter receptor subunit TctC
MRIDDMAARAGRLHLASLLISITAALVAAAAPVDAQTWPQHQVRLIVPLQAGSGPDLTARLLAERLSARWGQAVYVENRQGADGIVAVTALLGAHDNHTLLLSFAGIISINPYIHDTLPYDPAKDLVPICPIADYFLAVAASPQLGVHTLEDLVRLARAAPGKLNWAASPGLPQYVFASLARSAGIDMTEVSYRDFNQALTDLGEGRIQAAATGLPSFLPHVQGGRAKLLVLPGRQRSPLAPDVPTAAEAGYPDLTFDATGGLFASRDLPSDLVRRIGEDARAAALDPAMGARLTSVGAVMHTGTAADFATAIEEQRVKIAAIIASGHGPVRQ